jgi:hypothetical protein
MSIGITAVHTLLCKCWAWAAGGVSCVNAWHQQAGFGVQARTGGTGGECRRWAAAGELNTGVLWTLELRV